TMIASLFKKILITIMLFLCKQIAAQTEYIDGYILSDGKPIPSVYIRLTAGSKVLAYSSSDNTGYFIIKMPENINISELHLETSHLSFKPSKIALSEEKMTYKFILEPKSTEIQALDIKRSQRLSAKVDTLVFKVDSFARNEDRTIEDVMARMPGMHVAESGKISFNGKEITALYVDGSNLL